MSFAGLIYEALLWAAMVWMGIAQIFSKEESFLERMTLNRRMLFTFAIVNISYQCMAFNLHDARVGWLAEYYGARQCVYAARYVEWIICSPVVFMINGYRHPTDEKKGNRCGLVSSACLTGAYCAVAWQGLVVTNWWVAWLCILWSFVCYGVASAEQLAFAFWIKDFPRGGALRAGMLMYLVVICGIYGLVYLATVLGLLPFTFEHKFYSFFDATFKLGTSVLNLAIYDLGWNEQMLDNVYQTSVEPQQLVTTASVPIFGVDLDARIMLWNDKMAELTGLQAERAAGRSLSDMVPNPEPVLHAVHATLEGTIPPCLQTTVQAPGTWSHQAILQVSFSPRRDRLGKIVGVTMVGCDLTEIETYKEAESRKACFMAVMSHELRSPLHGVIGLASQLAHTEPDTERKRMLDLVGSCAGRLLNLVVNIMETASLRQGNLALPKSAALHRDPVELGKIIEEVAVLVSNSVDKNDRMLLKPGLQLVNRVGVLPIIEGDAHRLTQVFCNLVTNACKFTAKGSVEITALVARSGRWVEVKVRDTGIGIAREALSRIFEPFEQEGSGDRRPFEGIGLGLTIVQEVVRLHGGRIRVSSQLGLGSCFSVRLPAVLGESVDTDEEDDSGALAEKDVLSSKVVPLPEEVEVAVKASDRKAQVRRKREKPVVLSVDDDEVNQLVIESIMRPDFEVHTAMDGHEALAYLRDHINDLPDCVLLDLMMPGMSGFDVSRAIRHDMQLDAVRLPILMLSANPYLVTSTNLMAAGCNDYITKPFDKGVLLAHLQSACGISPLAKGAPR